MQESWCKVRIFLIWRIGAWFEGSEIQYRREVLERESYSDEERQRERESVKVKKRDLVLLLLTQSSVAR